MNWKKGGPTSINLRNHQTMPGLKVVALISGGKDSLFSILHCQRNGHEVVALANLYPADVRREAIADLDTDKETDDINSYMYQTVGHAVIPLYAEALGLPLYRQHIHGTNVDSNKIYDPQTFPQTRAASDERQEDETESLLPLLRQVLAEHPSVTAISTGAILSDYQRTRVESVALRLNLTPLSYLWQYPYLPPHTQTSLLEDMYAVGQDSRIIKVASGGLGTDHLWLGLGEHGAIQRLVRDFGRLSAFEGSGGLETGSVLGEGGEFETLAMNGPSCLWKKRIVVAEEDRMTVQGEGGTWALKISRAETAEMEPEKDEDSNDVRVPNLLDARFETMRRLVGEHKSMENTTKMAPANAMRNDEVGREPLLPQQIMAWQIKETADTVWISNMMSEGASEDAATQTVTIMEQLSQLLQERHLNIENISLTVTLLRNMADFAIVNKRYAEFFQRPSPPARVTVGCGGGLPNGKRLMMSVSINRRPRKERIGLHVQSWSYWAPANIGPYSQAISVPTEAVDGHRQVFIAGQIPLRPATMEVVSSDFVEQALLSLQHLWRIGQATKVHWWIAGAVAFTVSSSEEESQQKASIVHECWTLAHTVEMEDEDDEDEDIADRSLHRGWGRANAKVSIKTPLWTLPDWDGTRSALSTGANTKDVPPCYAVQVSELPKGAQVEWWSQGVQFQGTSNAGEATFIALGRHDAIEEQIMKDIRQTAGLTEIFAGSPLTGELLALAQEVQAMIIPCKGIYCNDIKKLETLIRYRK
ncbi:hypothetical protein FH972_021192 [Carpinus fangiana]|uniref:Diphthine--ammonia ligase n=1 Tax=Carpinus fangiana TaxID=176857 RepID=A0A5N6KNT7_9ROSI|nr:hypothetical protein FH972_021192 [Carpinus fangiana]